LSPALATIEAKQDGIHTDIVLLRQDVNSQHIEISEPPPLSLYQHLPPRKNMRASTMRKWLLTPGIMLLYCRSARQRQRRHSLFFGAVLPGSKVFLVHWMGFSYGIGMSLKGDVLGVRELLKSRRARPNDIAETNETLLLVCRSVTVGLSYQSLLCSVCNYRKVARISRASIRIWGRQQFDLWEVSNVGGHPCLNVELRLTIYLYQEPFASCFCYGAT